MFDAQRELATRYLSHFTRQAWKIVEPGAEFVSGWHIDAITDHLEAVALSFINDAIERDLIVGEQKPGAIRRLIINIPPRHMKSLSCSVMLPAWLWTRLPWLRFLFISYAEQLSIRDSVKCRRIIQSDWYQRRWGAIAQEPKKDRDGVLRDRRLWLTGDQNQKVKFENNRTGVRQATSVEGMATGEGGDAIIVDDPHNVLDTTSVTGKALDTVQQWWDEVMPTRLNDPKTGVKIIIMQRCHEKDLTGHILSKEHDYVHLCLPARFEPDHKYKWAADPRSIDGEPLWKGKYDEKELSGLEKDMTAYARAGQLQQRPAPREGGILKREWFKIVPADRVPNLSQKIRWWDMADTKKEATNDPDFTSGAKVGIDKDKNVYIMNVVSLRESSLKIDNLVMQTAELDGKACHIWMEQEPGSGGKRQCEYFLRMLIGYAFRYETSGNKSIYVNILAAGAERGIVYIVGAPTGQDYQPAWIEKFLEQATAYPNAAHIDDVDAVAKAYCKITARGQIFVRAM